VIRGHIDTDEGMSHVIAGMGVPAAPHLAFAGEIRAALGVPTFHAARIADIATANVAAAGGHRMVLFEAAPPFERSGAPGRRARASARDHRHRRLAPNEIERLGVDLRCNVFAEAGDVLAEGSDVVVIATGGIPNTSFLAEAEELAVTSWDILGGHVAPARDVLLFDDNGRRPSRGVVRRVPGPGRRPPRARDA
jgi:N-methyl-L-proline demethylase